MGNNKGLSIASMACGIAGCVLGFTGYGGILGLAAAIVGVVLSKKAVEQGGENNFNKTGKICGFVGIGLSALGLLVAIIICSCYACMAGGAAGADLCASAMSAY